MGDPLPCLKLFGASGPIPRGTFPSPEKYPKGRIGGGHFRLCPPPKNHPPQRPMRGLRPPLWILPRTVLWTARGPLKISFARAEERRVGKEIRCEWQLWYEK